MWIQLGVKRRGLGLAAVIAVLMAAVCLGGYLLAEYDSLLYINKCVGKIMASKNGTIQAVISVNYVGDDIPDEMKKVNISIITLDYQENGDTLDYEMREEYQLEEAHVDLTVNDAEGCTRIRDGNVIVKSERKSMTLEEALLGLGIKKFERDDIRKITRTEEGDHEKIAIEFNDKYNNSVNAPQYDVKFYENFYVFILDNSHNIISVRIYSDATIPAGSEIYGRVVSDSQISFQR